MNEKIHLTFMDLVLDDKKEEYQAGDELSGFFKVRFTGQLHLSQIKICLSCKADVDWIENPGTSHHRSGHVYQNRKKILDLTYAIPSRYDDDCLQAGEHEIPFSFKLPEKGIPSSFRSPHGSIAYLVEGVINEPAIEEVHKIGTEIVVDSPFREDLELSVCNSVEKDFGLLSFASGKITVYASLMKKGYVAGEVIELHTWVKNDSSIEATPRATLYQTQIYMCGERHKAFEVALSDPVVGKPVAEKTEFTEILFITVPDYASLTTKTGAINIKYLVHVTLEIPHAIDIHVNLPIIITNKFALNDTLEIQTELY